MERLTAVFKPESKYRAYFLSVMTFSLAYGLYNCVIDNYLAEIVGMSGFDKGVSEFFRELPGLLLVFILAALYAFSAERIYRLGALFMLAGMVDHMIDGGELEPLYIVSPCFYDPKETDKTPAASGVAVQRFIGELRDEVLPLSENHIGRPFTRKERAIGGFSMGGVTTWYAFMEALDLFYWFLPLSGDCWACGEKGGGEQTEATVQALIGVVTRQGTLDYRLHAITGSRDIAFPNLDPQMKAMDEHKRAVKGNISKSPNAKTPVNRAFLA